MNKPLNLLAVMMLTLLVTASCTRRPLEEENWTYDVSVEVDWSQSGLPPGEVSLLFYPHDGAAHREYVFVGTHKTLNLKPGSYSVIAFNQKMGDFDGIGFRGVEQYHTLQAFLKPVSNFSGGPLAYPDVLVSAARDEFTVSTSAANQQERTLRLTLKPLVTEARLTVHVQNLYMIKRGTQKGIITGMAESVQLSTQQTTSVAGKHEVELLGAYFYPDDALHGYMQDKLTVFGICNVSARAAQPVVFRFEAALRTSEPTLFTEERDVADLIEYKEEENTLRMYINIGINPEISNPPILIPPQETDGSQGGFDPDVDGWGDENEVIKPL